MPLTTALLGLVALVSPSLVSTATPGYHALPWDGSAYNLTVDTLTNKYSTPIFIQRNGGNNGNPADYISMQYQARPEGYNSDDGALAIGVDDKAIFNDNTGSRRSDLFQQIEGTADGTTFYRASLMKTEAFLNAYDWQLVFLGSGVFTIGVDASVKPPLMYYRTNGTTDARWSAEFVTGTWYNFGIGVEKSADGANTVLEFYTSTGQDELVFNVKTELKGSILTKDSFHIGPVTTLSGTSSAMNAKQDVVLFNGMSAEATPIDAGAPTPAPSEGGTVIVADSSSGSTSTAGEARSFTFNDRK
ncbi:hypothetical protein F441_05634 [Phytophthora nicotianae CJ01A1]|uniref:Glycoside hydrolase 131 catalytic N-terminal domain-containing protein n=3 Tax=Phytophthora nicotianae TaxID=4792 RepID=V9FIM4_PHYNI|nr:hypothetical protein F443_05625 [Phytophthora nicotianae P1569]ETK90814.1 hypothetical protein L915_05485 [Phytophthora nicotianae]ETP20695.1 hypothetical protein F441_05634 [Phytophthora nicotianae CJ01A1]ETL44222.1 hypothetical protein L916_05431 [Phytophthora nicotianae]ETL97396.1 hypothetical protein L917_05316 [Phytophthora nicotianae]